MFGITTVAKVAVAVSLGSMDGAGLWRRRQVVTVTVRWWTLQPETLAMRGRRPK